MFTNTQLHEFLASASRRHGELRGKFLQFSKHVKDELTAPGFHIKGITVSHDPAQDFFEVTFVGRQLRFSFTSRAETGAAALRGVVACHLHGSGPELQTIQIGLFTFNGQGQSDVVDPEEKTGVHIDYDLSAIYIALHFINESLSK